MLPMMLFIYILLLRSTNIGGGISYRYAMVEEYKQLKPSGMSYTVAVIGRVNDA